MSSIRNGSNREKLWFYIALEPSAQKDVISPFGVSLFEIGPSLILPLLDVLAQIVSIILRSTTSWAEPSTRNPEVYTCGLSDWGFINDIFVTWILHWRFHSSYSPWWIFLFNILESTVNIYRDQVFCSVEHNFYVYTINTKDACQCGRSQPTNQLSIQTLPVFLACLCDRGSWINISSAHLNRVSLKEAPEEEEKFCYFNDNDSSHFILYPLDYKFSDFCTQTNYAWAEESCRPPRPLFWAYLPILVNSVRQPLLKSKARSSNSMMNKADLIRGNFFQGMFGMSYCSAKNVQITNYSTVDHMSVPLIEAYDWLKQN